MRHPERLVITSTSLRNRRANAKVMTYQATRLAKRERGGHVARRTEDSMMNLENTIDEGSVMKIQ